MTFPTVVILCACLIGVCHAYTVFNSNCTAPTQSYNYVESGGVRGTLDIVWSCYGTLLACVYTVLHQSIPKQKVNHTPYWARHPTLYRIIAIANSVLIAIIAPEMVLVSALTCYFNARTQLRRLHRSFPSTKDDWTIVHMLYADMGGFVLRQEPMKSSGEKAKDAQHKGGAGTKALSPPSPTGSKQRDEESPLAPGKQLPAMASVDNKNSAASQDSDVETKDRNSGTKTSAAEGPTTSEHYTHAALEDKDPLEPEGNEAHKQVSPKDSSVERAPEPSTQALYNHAIFHLHAISLRKCIEEGLLPPKCPITKGEIKDAAKSDWFSKLVVLCQLTGFLATLFARASQNLAVSQLEIVIAAYVFCAALAYPFLFQVPKDIERTVPLATYEHIPRSILIINAETITVNLDPAVAFGAIHLAAWDLHFPSNVDQYLWRVSAMVVTCIAPVVFLLYLTFRWLRKTQFGTGFAFPAVVFTGLYILARLALAAEMIRTLFFLPPSAYLTPDWSIDIPHIG